MWDIVSGAAINLSASIGTGLASYSPLRSISIEFLIAFRVKGFLAPPSRWMAAAKLVMGNQ